MSIVKSQLPDVKIPDIPLHTELFTRFAEHGNKIALVDGITGEQYTYKEFLDISKRVASGLAKLGLKKGDVVSVFSYNTLEWFFIYMGVVGAGGVITAVNPSYTKYELEHHLSDSKAKYLFTVKDLLSLCFEAAANVPTVEKIISCRGTMPGCIAFEKLLNDDGALWPKLAQLKYNIEEDVVLIPSSSGTTGVPKGVMLTHYNFMSIVAIYAQVAKEDPQKMKTFQSDHQKVLLALLPLYHVSGLMGFPILGFESGSKLIVLSKFIPKTFLDTIVKYRIDFLHLVPPLVIFLAKAPLVQKYDLSCVKKVLCGAAPIPKNVEIELQKRINIPDIRQAYGMTETTSLVTFISATMELRPGSCGKLVPNTQVKVVDPTSGRLLGPNETGELWLRGPQIMKGYLNNPKATRETIDKDGFLHTGDIGYYDNDGYFYVVDRIKELIKVKGLQVAPAELEATLLKNPKIGDAGVIGIPDERAGELPKAFIVKKPGVPITADEIHSYVAEHLAPHKQLKGGVEFITEIPRLPSGKIIRRKLKEM